MGRILLSMTVVAVLTFGQGVSQAATIEWVTVDDPDNAGESSGPLGDPRICGDVSYAYQIGKYEVTVGQYTEFLNAVAGLDSHSLYDPLMWTAPDNCGIERNGSQGSYTYSIPDPNWTDRPVNFVSWYNALRFSNWLHNGQRQGVQDESTTENGAYDMSLGSGVVRKPEALVWLPTENEWYKAAYYDPDLNDGMGGYWGYPTRSNTAPKSEAPPGTDMIMGSANYYSSSGSPDPMYYFTEVGAYSAKPSDSVYGTFDQAGNVAEWTETRLGWGANITAIFRGGDCFAKPPYLHAAGPAPGAHLGSGTGDRGFRVASIPEPSTFALLAMGAFGILVYAFRKRN